MTDRSLEGRIVAQIEPSLESMGYELVRVQFMGKPGGGPGQTLQIMADRLDRATMTVDDCAAISRQVSALLDVEDPIKEAYDLEVSSPGIDRPLVKLADFERFAGFEAKIETTVQIEGRRRFRGRVTGVAGNDIDMILDDGTSVKVPVDSIEKAKLVLTDELIAAVTGEAVA